MMLSSKSKSHPNIYVTQQEQNTAKLICYPARANTSEYVVIEQEQNTSEHVYYPARAKYIWKCILSSKSKTYLDMYVIKQEQKI